jgi:hypothetical protein
MRATDRSVIAVTISVMLACFTVTPLTSDSSFIALSWVLIIAIGAASLALRRIRLSSGAVLSAQIAILLCYSLGLSLTLTSETSELGAPWFAHYPSLWAQGIEHMRTQASPMDPDNGVKLIFVTVIGLIMIMTDLLVSGVGRLRWLITEDQDRDEHGQRGKQQHEEPRDQNRAPAGAVEPAWPGKRPKTRKAGAHSVDPVLLVIGARGNTLRRERGNLHRIEDPHGLRRSRRRTVVSQRRPRGDKTVVGRNGILVPTAVLAGKSTSVLPMSTSSEHGVDVQRVDLARETGSRGRVGGCSLAEQDHHRGRVGWVVSGERDSRWRRTESCVEPELTDPRWVIGQQRRYRYVHRTCATSPIRARIGGAAAAGPRFIRRSGRWLSVRHHSPSHGLDAVGPTTACAGHGESIRPLQCAW